MPDIDHTEKLIVALGHRVSEQNEILQMIAASLQGVECHLRQIAISSNPAPNYQRPLSDYPGFNWPSIGATVLKEDHDGATAVEWNGQVFTRRSPNNKFDAAIWFSRCTGKDADGCYLNDNFAVLAWLSFHLLMAALSFHLFPHIIQYRLRAGRMNPKFALHFSYYLTIKNSRHSKCPGKPLFYFRS
jgi:DdrB-like protein